MAFEAFAGQAPEALPEGCIAYIGTGGPLPEGADAVVQIEDSIEQGQDEQGRRLVKILLEGLKPGHDVREVRRGGRRMWGKVLVAALLYLCGKTDILRLKLLCT